MLLIIECILITENILYFLTIMQQKFEPKQKFAGLLLLIGRNMYLLVENFVEFQRLIYRLQDLVTYEFSLIHACTVSHIGTVYRV